MNLNKLHYQVCKSINFNTMKKTLLFMLLVSWSLGGFAQEAEAEAKVDKTKKELKEEKKKEKKKKKAHRSTNGDEAAIGGSSTVVETKETNLSLADYLRRVPGVQVSGSGQSTKVLIRGASTSTGSTEPLFIIDRTPIGNNYGQVASMVDVNNIRRVEVLKDAASTSFYGMRGSNGVIIIRTKKK